MVEYNSQGGNDQPDEYSDEDFLLTPLEPVEEDYSDKDLPVDEREKKSINSNPIDGKVRGYLDSFPDNDRKGCLTSLVIGAAAFIGSSAGVYEAINYFLYR